MDSETLVTPQQETDSLTLSSAAQIISTVPSDETQSAAEQDITTPPSPASAAKVGGEAISSSPAVLLPAPSPAWESAANIEVGTRRQTSLSAAPLTTPAATIAKIMVSQPMAHSAPNQTGGPPSTSNAHGFAAIANSKSSEWVLSAPPSEHSAQPSSVWGNDQDLVSRCGAQQVRAARRAFFPSSFESTTGAPTPQMRAEETWHRGGTNLPAAGEEEDEPSTTRSTGSGIFELEIASPEVVSGPQQDTVRGDSVQTLQHATDQASWQLGPHDQRASHGSAIASSMPRFTTPLQGPWGRLQEVIDEIKDFSPQRQAPVGKATTSPLAANTSAQPNRPSPLTVALLASPPAEKRKGLDPTTAHFNTTALSEMKSPPQHLYRPQSPRPGSAIVVAEHAEDPPAATPASGSPADVMTTAHAFTESTVLSQTEAMEPLPFVAKQREASVLAAVDTQEVPGPGLFVEGTIETLQVVERPRIPAMSATLTGLKAQDGKSALKELTHTTGESISEQATQEAEGASELIQPLIPGALLAPEAREATRAWAAALTRNSEAESGKDTSSSESKSGFDIGWGKGWGVRGDFMEGDNAERDILGTSWDSRRGSVRERFIRAAEVLSNSPQLRLVAGAAASAVTSAAGTARVNFTRTSSTISKVLVASAKSFEEFVEEQMRQDGSGQVLRREGATGLLIPRGKTLTQAFVVAAGCYLCWEFRVKDHDLGFALRLRTQGIGGSTEEDIFEMKRYRAGETFQGRWIAEGDLSVVVIMVWDNSYSCLRPKTLAYKVHVLQPGVYTTGLPPPPPPTPAASAVDISPPSQATGTSSEGGVRSGGGDSDGWQHKSSGSHAAYTEAFAIDDLDQEEPCISGGYRGEPVAGGERTHGERPLDVVSLLVDSEVGFTDALQSGEQSYVHSQTATRRVEEGKEGEGEQVGDGEKREREPETIQIEDFLGTNEGTID